MSANGSDNNENDEASSSSSSLSSSFLLENLPLEMLFHIIKLINQSDSFALCQVSRKFNELILTPGVINTITCHYFLLQSNNFYDQIVAPRGKFIRKLIVDNMITDGQVRRLLALCPNLLIFEQRKSPLLYQRPDERKNEILLALATYCKQVKEVTLATKGIIRLAALQQFATDCPKVTSLSDAYCAITMDNILQVINAGGLQRLAKINFGLTNPDLDTLLSLRITHLTLRSIDMWLSIVDILVRCPHLQQFQCKFLDNMDLITNKLSSTCKNLTSVTLGFINQTDTLKNLVHGCQMIEFADLRAESTVDESILRTIGDGWKNLKSLTFGMRFRIKTKDIFSSLGQCSQLHSVDFVFSTITDAILADNIRCLPTRHLNHLYISSVSARELTAQAISDHLANITSAKYDWSNFTSAVCDRLFNMEHLTHLCVNESDFLDNEDVGKLAGSSSATTLQRLEFCECRYLTDECFRWFAKFKNLRQLLVGGVNEVTDGAIQALTQCDELCKRLQHLEIIGQDHQFGFTEEVFEFLKKFTDLRTCKLYNFNQLSQAAIDNFINTTQSPFLMTVEFSKREDMTTSIHIRIRAMETQLLNMGQAVDSFYENQCNNYE